MSGEVDERVGLTETSHPKATLAALRERVARMERGVAVRAAGWVSLCAPIDRALPNGGLDRGAVHDVLSDDIGAAIGFCALTLGRAAGNIVWIGAAPDLWPPGLATFGLSAADIVFVDAFKAQDALWAFEEALRSPGTVGAVCMIQGSPPGLIANRRLQLAAEAGGGIGLLLMQAVDRVLPSASRTRWRVGAAPGPCSGDPRWHVALVRCAGGRPADWLVAWNRQTQQLEVMPPIKGIQRTGVTLVTDFP